MGSSIFLGVFFQETDSLWKLKEKKESFFQNVYRIRKEKSKVGIYYKAFYLSLPSTVWLRSILFLNRSPIACGGLPGNH